MRLFSDVARVASLVLATTVLPVIAGSPVVAAPADVPLRVDVRETTPFTMVAATWEGEAPQRVRVSTRTGSQWSSWQELEHLEDGPVEAEREGTHLVWVGAQAASAVRVEQTGGAEPVRLVLLDTTEEPPDEEPATEAPPVVAPPPETVEAPKATPRRKVRKTKVPRPRIRSRAKWGANEKWREDDPVFNATIKQVHVHHTASGNGYRRKDVPGIIRGFYRYHTKSLGWSDIGYNALVDRFGRAWVGRRGGLATRTRGAHTLGFNHASTGIAVIGTYTDVKPSKKSIRTVARIAAWQLDRHDSRARGKVKVRSKGSTRFKKGRKVKLPIIDGHRHTNHTLCPGQKLFDRLPKIRRIAQRRINRF